MAVVKTFRAIRPTSELADKVAALPYDVMNSEEARQMVVGKPLFFPPCGQGGDRPSSLHRPLRQKSV